MAKRKRKAATKPRATKPTQRKRTPKTKPKRTSVSKPRRATPVTRKPAAVRKSSPSRTKGDLSASPAGRPPTSKRSTRAPVKVAAKSPSLGSGVRRDRSRGTLSKSATAARQKQAAATRKRNEREQQRKRDQRNEAQRRARAEAKAIAEAKHAQRLDRRRELYKINKEKKRAGGYIPDERAQAIGWLEHIRNRVAEIFPVSLSVTEAGGGHAELEGEPARTAATTPWLVVGRYDPQDEIDYQTLAEAFQMLADDLPLEVAIGGQRLSQIRIVFHDPRSKRGEGDSVISRIGAWTFILGDLIGELIGSDIEDPDEGSLAGRYDQTSVPMWYIFFSSTITKYNVVGPWAKTQTVKLK